MSESMSESPLQGASASPFDLASRSTYEGWREWKLGVYPETVEQLIVPINHPHALDRSEKKALLERCKRANMALYQLATGSEPGKQLVRALGRQFGLERLDNNLRADEDSITALRVVPEAGKTHYIPYTNRPLNWHTDGYYNSPDEQVRAIVMHCVADAVAGGDNSYLDHEIAYLLMRDENPDYIRALMQPDAMTIPANVEDGAELRPVQSGPVFSVQPLTGTLHMRYTARTRSIVWKDDRNTRLAAGFLAELLASDSAYIFRHHMQAGQGVICNNVLHRREAFTDAPEPGQQRLLYRARYHDRIHGTELNNVWSGV
ncbi:MAG: TauD/TfdA family dioxygenase [Gammaproteobacteria bacterium]|nr:TauD/TfdA family dioxygenase [Gammaproteobacteria bacterium]